MKELLKLEIASAGKIELDIQDPFVKELEDLWNSRDLSGVLLKIYQGVNLVGVLLVETNVREAINRGLYVVPEYRGKRIAKNLLDYLHKIFYNRFIWTNITKGSEEIYERYGYKTVGFRSRFNQYVAYFPNEQATPENVQGLIEKVDTYK